MPDDSYLSIAAIARDETMNDRLNACAVQQMNLGSITIPPIWGDGESGALSWVANNRFLWASQPGWAAAWDYALNVNSSNPDYNPATDAGVITDGMILAAVQDLAPTAAPGTLSAQAEIAPEAATATTEEVPDAV